MYYFSTQSTSFSTQYISLQASVKLKIIYLVEWLATRPLLHGSLWIWRPLKAFCTSIMKPMLVTDEFKIRTLNALALHRYSLVPYQYFLRTRSMFSSVANLDRCSCRSLSVIRPVLNTVIHSYTLCGCKLMRPHSAQSLAMNCCPMSQNS